MVNGAQAHSSGSDEASDPLQLAVPYIVLENDVVGEVDAPGWLQGGRSLTGQWNATLLGVPGNSHRLGDGAFVVFHPDLQSLQGPLDSWASLKGSVGKKSQSVLLRAAHSSADLFS